MAAEQGSGRGLPTTTQFWDTANHRMLSESAALTIMTPFALQLLTKAVNEGRTTPASALAEQVQKLSNVEIRQDDGTWLTALLARVDQRRASADQPPLSTQVSSASAASGPIKRTKRPVGKTPTPTRRTAAAPPLEGAICPSCFTQMSLTGVCDQCA